MMSAFSGAFENLSKSIGSVNSDVMDFDDS